MKFVAAVSVGFVLQAVLMLLLSVPTMLAWNYLMPKVLSLPAVSYGQALVMLVLCNCLFKNVSVSTGVK